MGAFDLWAIGGLLFGAERDLDPQTISEPLRPLFVGLATLPLEARQLSLNAFFWGRPEAEALVYALANIEPTGPPPEREEAEQFATVADIRRDASEASWTWKEWIANGCLFGLAGAEGSGKTRTAMDLHRRAFHGLTWPDGQAATLEPGRPVIWLCSDGQHDEIADLLTAYGLPDTSIIFPTLRQDPYGGTDLDAPELVGPGGTLERAILAHKPWCVFVDTLTNATQRDLCEQSAVKRLKDPLVRLAQSHGVIVALLLHLSKDGQALGRRIKGVTRTLMHLECPNPENEPSRLRYWIEKSFAKKPPPLGLTMSDRGNDYDFAPPSKAEPERKKSGPPPEKMLACVDWLRTVLVTPARVTDLRKGAAKAGVIPSSSSAATLYAAQDVLKIEEFTLEGKKWWKLPTRDTPEPKAPEPSDAT